MKFSTIFIAPAVLAAFLIAGKGCGQAVISTGDDQDGMSTVEKTVDNIFDDVASIAGIIFQNAKERTPDEIKEAGRALSDSVREASEQFNERERSRNILDDIESTQKMLREKHGEPSND